MSSRSSRDDSCASSSQSIFRDRYWIYKNFCCVTNICFDVKKDKHFTCVKYMPGGKSIIAGTYLDKLLEYSVPAGNIEKTYDTQSGEILHIEPYKTGKLILGSSKNLKGYNSYLWNYEGTKPRFMMENQQHAEFNHSQDNIVCTQGKEATTYDTTAGTKISTFTPANRGRYEKNKATFSPDGKLVLTDGVLFDVKSKQPIYTFEKSKETQNGVFHPNGLEIIFGRKIYDIKTYRILFEGDTFEKRVFTFSPEHQVIFTRNLLRHSYGAPINDLSYILVLDETNKYEKISHLEFGREVCDVAINNSENQLAVVANEGQPLGSVMVYSCIHLIDIGKEKDHVHRAADNNDDALKRFRIGIPEKEDTDYQESKKKKMN